MLLLKTDLSQIVSILGIFLLVAFRLLPSGNRIISSIQAIRYGAPTIKLIASELCQKVIMDNESIKSKIPHANVFIKFSDLSFKYESANKNILNKINFEINKGETIGIMGKSGSGKSTLINILLCLLKPNEGEVFFNGVSIFLNPNEWRKNIGYVPQNIFLIDDSIKKNIAFGLLDSQINDEKVFKSIKLAQLDDYINTLPDGINTNVGDRGIKISGGQRQRIGIARALYNDPDIIILDEATSALDSETENDFMDIIYEMNNNKTIIIITHRPSTLSKANRIFEIENGRLVKATINA